MTQSVRQVTDAKVLSALVHPLRRRLLDVLRVDGPATASMLSARTEQAVGNISHHLKVLAASELVEEAPELARDRRERWWRLVSRAVRWNTRDFDGDEAAEAIVRAGMSLDLERENAFVRRALAADDDERAFWPDGPFATRHWLRVDDAELSQFADEVVALYTRWADRDIPDDGRERRTVFAYARAVPATP